jgi:hypothetical protein
VFVIASDVIFHIAYLYSLQAVFVEKYWHGNLNRYTLYHFMTRVVFMAGSEAIRHICNPSEPQVERKILQCFLQLLIRHWTEFTGNLQH